MRDFSESDRLLVKRFQNSNHILPMELQHFAPEGPSREREVSRNRSTSFKWRRYPTCGSCPNQDAQVGDWASGRWKTPTGKAILAATMIASGPNPEVELIRAWPLQRLRPTGSPARIRTWIATLGRAGVLPLDDRG